MVLKHWVITLIGTNAIIGRNAFSCSNNLLSEVGVLTGALLLKY
jgi:hypothetical protein